MNNCPGCLKKGYETYCPSCLKKLFGGKKVDSILPFNCPQFNEHLDKNAKKLSISGAQVKFSLKLENDKLVLTEQGGEYILKPVPKGRMNNHEAAPANEHLTMQIASQVFKIKTAENALVFFPDNEAAYIAKRFDRKPDGTRKLQEDFAQILGRTDKTGDGNYKYEASYEEIAEAVRAYSTLYKIELENYFKVLVFNYIIYNGDAHLKNFSLIEHDTVKTRVLTPAYDLMNTSLHREREEDTALDLFKDGFETVAFQDGSKYTYPDFFEFGRRIGINEKRVEKILGSMLGHDEKVKELANRSFLPDELKKEYIESYGQRIKRIIKD
jgi:serine/threonine-protein kinase HipA